MIIEREEEICISIVNDILLPVTTETNQNMSVPSRQESKNYLPDTNQNITVPSSQDRKKYSHQLIDKEKNKVRPYIKLILKARSCVVTKKSSFKWSNHPVTSSGVKISM